MVIRGPKISINDLAHIEDLRILNSTELFTQENLNLRSEELQFVESEHKYYADGKQLLSVTQWLSRFFPKFNPFEQALKSQSSETSQYYNWSIQEILAAWRKKTNAGTVTHAAIEKYLLFGESTEDVKALNAIQYIEHVRSKFMLMPQESHPEVRVFSSEIGLAGTVDWIVHVAQGVILYDWKTSGTLHFDRAKYYAQLNTYAYILEKFYNIPVVGMRLVHLKENNFEVHVVPKTTALIEEYLVSTTEIPGLNTE
jgi:ATP-dependent exoDNAse (exonuclease V) beta subunit